MKRCIFILASLICATVCAGRPLPTDNEVAWSKGRAEERGGEAEARLPDGTRVDVLTSSHAWEVEWAAPQKHYEAFGQACYYGIWTDKAPGVIMLQRSNEDIKWVLKCKILCARYNVRLKVVDVR